MLTSLPQSKDVLYTGQKRIIEVNKMKETVLTFSNVPLIQPARTPVLVGIQGLQDKTRH